MRTNPPVYYIDEAEDFNLRRLIMGDKGSKDKGKKEKKKEPKHSPKEKKKLKQEKKNK